MNVLQATDGLGNLYALNFQHFTPESIRFDIFHYSSVNQKGVNEPSDVEFPFDNWLCAEMIIDPFNEQDLTLYINGRRLATLSGVRTPGVPVSWELRIGTASVSDTSAAPRILFDDVLVDRANKPAC